MTAPLARRRALVRSLQSAGVALAVLGGFLAWMGGAFREKTRPGEVAAPKASAAGRELRAVEAHRVEEGAPVVASVQPRRRTEFAAQVQARILQVSLEPGETVEPGKVLVRLDDLELRAQQAEAEAAVAVAEADLALRKVDYARAQRERTGGVISDTDFARYDGALKVSDAQVKRAKENVKRLAVQLTYTAIVAPARGVVADRYADPGDIASPGKVLMVVYDPSELELHANVPESLAPDVRAGQPVRVRIDAAGVSAVTGTVREVVPQAQPASRSVLVKIALPPLPGGKPLLPGMFGRVGIPIGTVERLFVPRAAVAHVGQLDLVEVVGPDGTVNRRFVRLGPDVGDRVEVLAGLRAGERVALPAAPR